jgi:hypothetical protein
VALYHKTHPNAACGMWHLVVSQNFIIS